MRTVFLVGPTAVGKSSVGLELACRWGAEIVSADAMQVYRGMDIGTSKPTMADRQRVPHHLLDVCDPIEVFDVQRFVKLARQAMTEIHARDRVALVVGGTGLYIRALRFGLFEGPGRDTAIRRKLEALSAGELHVLLSQLDPHMAVTIDPRNPRRLVRALEVLVLTGRSLRTWQRQWGDTPQLKGPVVGLSRDRADLVDRIERRVDEQMQAGWLEEVRRLMPLQGTAAQAIGYRELAAHLSGKCSLEEAVARIKARTRQLARRQMTWFRREPGLIWVEVKRDEPVSSIAGRVIKAIEAV